MPASEAQPPGRRVAAGVHHASGAHHGASDLRRSDLALIDWHDSSEHPAAYACDGPADDELRDAQRASIESTASGEYGASDEDGQLSSFPAA